MTNIKYKTLYHLASSYIPLSLISDQIYNSGLRFYIRLSMTIKANAYDINISVMKTPRIS